MLHRVAQNFLKNSLTGPMVANGTQAHMARTERASDSLDADNLRLDPLWVYCIIDSALTREIYPSVWAANKSYR